MVFPVQAVTMKKGVLLGWLLTFPSAVFCGPQYESLLLRLASPVASRLVKVNFYVDNRALLEKPFLEVTVVEDSYRKRVVSVGKGLSAPIGAGVSEMSVPQGDVHLAICGMVKCSSSREPELVCGKTHLPVDIDALNEHEVTFSTNWACEETPALLARQ